MTALTIRKFDESLKRKLKVRAAEHGRSMEAEAVLILERELSKSIVPKNLGQHIRELLAKHGVDGIELDIPPRSVNRKPPSFS